MCTGAEIALFGTLAAVGGATASAVGTYKSVQASEESEALRKQQLKADQYYRQAEIRRKAQLATATSLVNATNQGAGQGSGLDGGQAQIAQTLGRDSSQLYESGQIGLGLFSSQADEASWKGVASTGAGFYNLGKDVLASAPVAGQLITDFFTPKTTTSLYGNNNNG